MNSYSTFGIVVFLLFVYSTPTQGNIFGIMEVAFENGKTFNSKSGIATHLVRSFANVYQIQQTTFNISESETSKDETSIVVENFEITGIDTIIGKDLVLRTNDNSYLQMELITPTECQRLFTLTTRSKLGERLYSFKVSEVHEYLKGPILNDASISGFMYLTTDYLQHRYIIHLGQEFDRDSEMRLLWTEKGFNYFSYDNTSIILTVILLKPEQTYHMYYLVKFAKESDLLDWCATPGRYYSDDIPLASREVSNYFHDIMKKRKA